MILIKPSAKPVFQATGIDGMFEMIAKAAYVCYQTDPNKAKYSPKEFVEKTLIPHEHFRPLEFGTVYMKFIPSTDCKNDYFRLEKVINNHWTRCNYVWEDGICFRYITTNYRVIHENNVYDLMEKYWCEPTDKHEKRYTYDFICSRGVSDDKRTHIMLSSCAESTRYCNYSKGKFGNEITFIEPYWFKWNRGYKVWAYKLYFWLSEKIYMWLARKGEMPEHLKRILPLDVKTELMLCGYKDAWENFIKKRGDRHADGECQELTRTICLMSQYTEN